MTRIKGCFSRPTMFSRRKPDTLPFSTFAETSFDSDKSSNEFKESTFTILNSDASPKKKTLRETYLVPINRNIFVIILFFLICLVILLGLILYGSSLKKNEANKMNYHTFKHDIVYPKNSHANLMRQAAFKRLPYPPKPDYAQCKKLQNTERLDCLPQGTINQESCENRGCCWIPTYLNNSVSELDIPYCFYPPNFPTYNYVNVTQTAFGLEAFLKRSYNSAYPHDIEVIKLIAKFEGDFRLHVKILDPQRARYETPYPEVPIVDRASNNLTYSFILDPSKTGFKVLRKSDYSVIFDSIGLPNIIFANQFLQYSSKLSSSLIYGVGEHTSPLLIDTKGTTFTMFNHDGIPGFNKNLYGSHPFYMALEKSTKAHGVLLLNSNAMDILFQYGTTVTFRPIGGILDFYFFTGPTPADVVRQYLEVVGTPFMVPYWGLGFHLCRFGYKTLNQTKAVMQRNIDKGIPLDTQWNDLDYMNNSNDFTYDKIAYKDLPQFVNDLHGKGMHYIPLIDPGVSASEVPGTYEPYDKGVQMNIFVKNFTGGLFIGKVWNKGNTVWPDFTLPTTVDYWTAMFRLLHQQVNFDGAWIDMNEPSNFLSGSTNGCPNSTLEYPPYQPGVEGGFLNYKTMCMSAKHYAGLHYDVHNLFGISEAIITNFALAEITGQRPFVISRSTFPGLGHFAGHWSGDVWSQWSDMAYSIPQLLNFNIFGIPLMGADICGFNGNTTVALCNRWMQLGAFYPFSRNHNTDDGIDQDPAALGDLVVNSAKKALRVRYNLLPYLYTLFWRAHAFGDTVARPLFFEFISDNNTYSIDTQFLWGPAFLIIPVLKENATSVKAYFPQGVWYNYYNFQAYLSKGEYVTIDAPLDTIPLFVRGGYVLPQQIGKALTTTESRRGKMQLLVALNINDTAEGELYWDDGFSLNTYEEQLYTLLKFVASVGHLKITTIHNQIYLPFLDKVFILGVKNSVASVTVDGIDHQSFIYNKTDKWLMITGLKLDFGRRIIIYWK